MFSSLSLVYLKHCLLVESAQHSFKNKVYYMISMQLHGLFIWEQLHWSTHNYLKHTKLPFPASLIPLLHSTTLLILAVPLSLNSSITILHYPQVGAQIFSISILLSIIVNTLMNWHVLLCTDCLPKWPRVLLEVSSLDYWDRHRIEGYGFVDLPCRPGLLYYIT